MILRKYFFLILLFPTISALAVEPIKQGESTPQQTGKQVLQNMANAMQTLNYQGTVAFLRNGKLEPMKYFHAARNGLEQERLLSLNSPLREIIRDTGKVSCLFKETHQRVEEKRPFDRSFLVDLPKNLDNLDNTYSITLLGEEEIAMLPAYVVALEAKDKFRYFRTIWVEKQHFLPLKAIVYDLANNVLEQLVFTELTIKNSLPFVDSKLKNESDADKPPLPLTEANFLISNIPSGFRELFFTRRLMHNIAQPVDHLLLSDGLAWISVYMEHKNPASPLGPVEPKAVQAVGAINFYSRSINNFEFTVMGDVPPETIKIIAENIKLRESK